MSKPVLANDGYSYQYKNNPDGSIGVDYFDPSGKPITNYVFSQATGQNITDSAAQQTYPNTSIGPRGQVNGANTLNTGDVSPQTQPLLPTQQQDTSTNAQNTQIYGNQSYDLNDPTQRLSYYQAVAQNLGTQRDQALTSAQNAFKTNDQASVNQYQQYLSTLDQNLADINQAAQQYAAQYGQTLNGFNEQKGQGDVNRQNYFSQISPNAFQSSQATSQGYANDKYNQGLADLTGQLQSNVGLNYYNSFDPANPGGANSSLIDPTSTYGREVGSVGTQRSGLQNSFDSYRQQAQQGLQNSQNSIYDQYNQGLASNAQNLGQIDLSQGTNPFQYGVQTTTPSQVAAPDLSQYTPYTSFGSLTGTQPGVQNAYKAPTVSNNAFSQPAIDTYLNRTKTTLPSGTSSSDWANKYLMGKITT